MPQAHSRLLVEQDDEITRIRFVDRNILEEGAIQQIGDEISRLIDQTPSPRILINFDGVEHLSSAALGALINVRNKVQKRDGQLRLSNIDPQIHEVFVITKLNKLFQIFDQADQAVQSFQ